jgi:succinyl-diaminopimelate desuccinylase
MTLEHTIENQKNEIIEAVQSIVKIKSVEEEPKGDMPFGQGVQEALSHTLDLCDRLGFRTKNIDNYAGYAEIGEGDELIGILAHLDVVPEGDLESWDYSPYAAEIHDGKIFGRGTIDDKGPAIAGIYAMKALLDSDLTLNKRIRIIFGTNEESGWGGINYYLKREEIPSIAFTPDADFPVIHGEMGILLFNILETFETQVDDNGIKILEIKGGNALYMVPDYAEARLVENKPFKHILDTFKKEHGIQMDYQQHDEHVVVSVEGKSAHGSHPEKGVNAISYLMKFLSLIDLQIGDLSNFVRFYAEHIALDYNGENIGCDLSDEVSGQLIFNVGTIEVTPEQGTIGVNIRYPITLDDQIVYEGMEQTIETSPFNMNQHITIEKLEHLQPIYLPEDSHLIETLMTVYKKHTGDDAQPKVIGGGTYARSMDNAVAFGPLFPGREGVEHQANEYIYIEDLIKATKIYADALKRLAED